MRLHFVALSFGAAVVLAFSSIAHATLVLDQYHDVVFDNSLASATAGQMVVFGPPYPPMIIDLAQTFTVGTDGWLQKVQIFAQPLSSWSKGPMSLDIRPTVDGVPIESNDAVLAKATLPWDEFVPDDNGYVTFNLSSSHLMVDSGDVLALVLRGDGTANVNGNIYDPYSGGRAFTRFSDCFVGAGTWTNP